MISHLVFHHNLEFSPCRWSVKYDQLLLNLINSPLGCSWPLPGSVSVYWRVKGTPCLNSLAALMLPRFTPTPIHLGTQSRGVHVFMVPFPHYIFLIFWGIFYFEKCQATVALCPIKGTPLTHFPIVSAAKQDSCIQSRTTVFTLCICSCRYPAVPWSPLKLCSMWGAHQRRGSRRCSAIVRGCQAVTPIIGHMVTTQCGDASHEGTVTWHKGDCLPETSMGARSSLDI